MFELVARIAKVIGQFFWGGQGREWRQRICGLDLFFLMEFSLHPLDVKKHNGQQNGG